MEQEIVNGSGISWAMSAPSSITYRLYLTSLKEYALLNITQSETHHTNVCRCFRCLYPSNAFWHMQHSRLQMAQYIQDMLCYMLHTPTATLAIRHFAKQF